LGDSNHRGEMLDFLQNKLNKLKNRKAEGKYGIPAELLKALGVKG